MFKTFGKLFYYSDFYWKDAQCSMDIPSIAQTKPRSVNTAEVWFTSTHSPSVWSPSRNIHSCNTGTTKTSVSLLRHSVCLLETATSLPTGQDSVKIN
jgi:hypothetical protein